MLSNKVVVITGVGSGLGQALAHAFVKQECVVCGIARREEQLRETNEIIGSENFFGYLADVADYVAIRAVTESIFSRHRGVHLLFNNAAVYPRVSFLDESAAEWTRAINININGVANCCKAVLPFMISAGYGRIYNIGSFAHLAPIKHSAAYSASKGAVRALTKGIAIDIQDLDVDIEVHEWIPGHLKTQMSEYTGIEPALAAEWAVRLASTPHARTRNCVFEMDREWLPPKRLKDRLTDRIRSMIGSKIELS